jgi:hypothetical protein
MYNDQRIAPLVTDIMDRGMTSITSIYETMGIHYEPFQRQRETDQLFTITLKNLDANVKQHFYDYGLPSIHGAEFFEFIEFFDKDTGLQAIYTMTNDGDIRRALIQFCEYTYWDGLEFLACLVDSNYFDAYSLFYNVVNLNNAIKQ